MSNSGVLVVIDMGKIKNIDINPTIDPKANAFVLFIDMK